MEPGAVIATLRTAGTDTDLPILAVTGPTPPPMQQEILNGFDIERVDYPVQHDALFDALEQTLARPSLQVTPPPAEGVPPDRSPH